MKKDSEFEEDGTVSRQPLVELQKQARTDTEEARNSSENGRDIQKNGF